MRNSRLSGSSTASLKLPWICLLASEGVRCFSCLARVADSKLLPLSIKDSDWKMQDDLKCRKAQTKKETSTQTQFNFSTYPHFKLHQVFWFDFSSTSLVSVICRQSLAGQLLNHLRRQQGLGSSLSGPRGRYDKKIGQDVTGSISCARAGLSWSLIHKTAAEKARSQHDANLSHLLVKHYSRRRSKEKSLEVVCAAQHAYCPTRNDMSH